MTGIDFGLFVLRVWIGVVMFAHGVKHWRGREKTTNWLESIGYRRPTLQWFAMSTSEIGAGVLLVLGLLTSPALAAVAAIMVVAYLTVHRRAGFWVTARPDEGWEYVATLTAAAVALAAVGPGRWSIDHGVALATVLDGWVGVGIVVGGIVAGIAQVAIYFRPTAS